MASGLCPRCGDASGERHLCVPPFLDRGAVTYNASSPPQLFGRAAQVPYIARLEAENARLRALLARYADVIGEDADMLEQETSC